MIKFKDRPERARLLQPRNSTFYQNGYNHAIGLWGSKEGKDTAEWNRGVAAANAHKEANKQCQEDQHGSNDNT